MNQASRIRWWPAVVILALGAAAYVVAHFKNDWVYEQQRSLLVIGSIGISYIALWLWWVFFSRASRKARVIGALVALLPLGLFRHRGMSGDFIPIFEFRFGKKGQQLAPAVAQEKRVNGTDFTHFLGVTTDGKLQGPELHPDWKANPPVLLWRKPVGAAWSGYVIAGNRAVTQEQLGGDEAVTCCDLMTGKALWIVSAPARYETKIAGEGPRSTPVIAGDFVYAFGATGLLRCIELSSGKLVWSRNVVEEAGITTMPDWGFASSPLVTGGNVIVSIGAPGKSLVAHRASDGAPVWAVGDGEVNYGSPFLRKVAGRDIVLVFNTGKVTGHDPATGTIVLDHEWGSKWPAVAAPVVTAENRVFFSSGYGVGSALWELKPGANGMIDVEVLWKTTRFQAKFSNPVAVGGYVYGISDGIFACLDLKDGKVLWKNGRYGHGQGLMVGAHYLQMTELPGDLVLLKPTPEAANELGRVSVFEAKTWNPIAISGDLVLLRNDQEAACLRLPVRTHP